MTTPLQPEASPHSANTYTVPPEELLRPPDELTIYNLPYGSDSAVYNRADQIPMFNIHGDELPVWQASAPVLSRGYGLNASLTKGHWRFRLYAFNEDEPIQVDTDRIAEGCRKENESGFGPYYLATYPPIIHTTLRARNWHPSASVVCSARDKLLPGEPTGQDTVQPGEQVIVVASKARQNDTNWSLPVSEGRVTPMPGERRRIEEVCITRLSDDPEDLLRVAAHLTHRRLSEADQQLVLTTLEAQFTAMDTVRDEHNAELLLRAFNAKPAPLRWLLGAMGKAPQNPKA